MVQKTKEKIKYCTVDNCESKVYARGWCRPHYRHVVEGGHKEPLPFYKSCITCNKEFINKFASKTLCRKCYYNEWKSSNIDSLKEYSKEYYQNNKSKIKQQCKEWRINNRDKENAWYAEKRKDPQYKVAHSLRRRLWQGLKGKLKHKSTEVLLGCSFKELMCKLELQFKSDMTWDNYGTIWHIDHIRPLCSYNLINECELEKAAHYSNLQAIYASENCSKATKDKKEKYFKK